MCTQRQTHTSLLFIAKVHICFKPFWAKTVMTITRDKKGWGGASAWGWSRPRGSPSGHLVGKHRRLPFSCESWSRSPTVTKECHSHS